MESILRKHSEQARKMNKFDFSPETAHLLSEEQQKHFLAPFVSSQQDYNASLHQFFPKAYRKAGALAVQDISIVVMKDVQDQLRKYPSIMLIPDSESPRTWGYACRYRVDVPWYVAAISDKFIRPSFMSYPTVHLGFYNDLMDWPPLDKFLSDGMWGVLQNKQPTWTPLVNFIHTLSPYLRADNLRDLFNTLRETDFFPSEESILANLDFTLERDDTPETRQELKDLARTIFPVLHDPELSQHWAKVFADPFTQVWLARSRFHPEAEPSDQLTGFLKMKPSVKPTILGFLIGGANPLNDQPQLHAVAVLPDERRRGIATSLVRRYFAQTGHTKLLACTQMGPIVNQYEGCGFLKSLGAEIVGKGSEVWRWNLPSFLPQTDRHLGNSIKNVK